jgi:rubrerythrin
MEEESTMDDLKGTQTEINLLTAFAGESQARNRYTYFSQKAKDEGYVQIATILTETADQEMEHAKRFFLFLQGGELEIAGKFPAGMLGTTQENLRAAADGENHESQHMYPEFARIAREEGFEAVARVFENVAVAERQHEKRFENLAAGLETGTMFNSEKPMVWRCINCGYYQEDIQPPETCPACDKSKAYYQMIGEMDDYLLDQLR